LQKISFINDKNMATIIRQSYIDKIEKYLGKETIIVLVDQRGVGKECS
jgi:SRSO17 transposase